MPQSLRIITPATDQPVTLAEAKEHARIDGVTDDALVTALIPAAAADAAAQLGGGAVLVEATFELTLDAFPAGDGVIELPARPATAMVSFKYDDTDGDEQTLASNAYTFTASATGPAESPLVASLRPLKGESWPSTADAYGAVRIRFKAGWPVVSQAATTPEQIKAWVKVRVADLYDQRETYVIGAGVQATAMPGRIFDGLLDPWRLWGCG